MQKPEGNRSVYGIVLIISLFCIQLNALGQKYPVVEIKTQFGKLYIWLYHSANAHYTNFISLADKGYYNNLTFHRVIKSFMIQGGDPFSNHPLKKDSIGEGGPGYELPAEIGHMHKRGVIAAARNGDEINPERKSSGSQFYIVQGKKYTDAELDFAERRINEWQINNVFCRLLYRPGNDVYLKDYLRYLIHNRQDSALMIRTRFQPQVDSVWRTMKPHAFTKQERDIYKTIGGAPHLDGGYTAFGEVIVGIEIIDSIAAVKTTGPPLDRPVKDVKMEVSIIWMKKKRFIKKFKTDPALLPE